tara:strand:+ start:88677 stop:89465 length:789 start_codon:yes stop_codon:yes gene_type:complete
MNAQEYIASGKLELFVYGTLSEAENKEVVEAANKFPEVREEIEKIETSLKKLSEGVSPGVSNNIWNTIVSRIKPSDRKVYTLERKTNWPAITGWAAAILFIGGLMWMMKQNNDLSNQIVDIKNQNKMLEEQIVSAEDNLENTRQLLEVIRDKNIDVVNLPGNAEVAPDAFAKVFYNKESKTVHLDAKGLPEPPEGMVYQVWSLKLDPLTPTSIGLLDDFTTDENKVFILQDIPDSEAFGITLEPAGGSETPTLTQLYTLGTI